MLDGAQRSICCSSLKTNKKQILRSAQDDMLGGFFSSFILSNVKVYDVSYLVERELGKCLFRRRRSRSRKGDEHTADTNEPPKPESHVGSAISFSRPFVPSRGKLVDSRPYTETGRLRLLTKTNDQHRNLGVEIQ